MKTKILTFLTLILSIHILSAQGPYISDTNASLHDISDSAKKINKSHNIIDPQYWEFSGGSKYFVNESSKTFQFALKNFKYPSVSKIGGIDFQQTLITDKKITISYNPNSDDGRRLQLIINGKIYSPYLADWQLKPIALFANDSEYTSILTYYGSHFEAYDGEFLYHEALHNTLLGVRLFQADITLFSHWFDYNTLPTYNGKEILGVGEILPNNSNEKIIDSLNSFAYDYNEYGLSWTITDYNLDITLNTNLSNENIFSDTKPYFHFWKTEVRYVWSEELKEQLDALHNNYKKEIEKYFTDNQIEYPEKYSEDDKTFFKAPSYFSIKKISDIEYNYESSYREILNLSLIHI